MSEGSSPRMRGTLVEDFHELVAEGIIPAYAGNTWFSFPRGDASSGSSPRMRGTLIYTLYHIVSSGIIPAYAGNTG